MARPRPAGAATALAVIILGLAALTLAGKLRQDAWREEDGFLLAVLLAVVLYFASPDGLAGGLLLKNRLGLYPWLLLIPWLAPRLARPGRAAVLAAVAIVTVWQIAMLTHWHRLLQPEIREFVAAAQPIGSDSRVLPLLYKRTTTALHVDVIAHALSYVDAEKGLVDWDYVFAWKMPPDARMGRVLGRQLKPVAESGPARVYKRKGRFSPSPPERGRGPGRGGMGSIR